MQAGAVMGGANIAALPLYGLMSRMLCLCLDMTKLLAELLGATDPFFAMGVRELERGTGDASVDVRLSADIITRANQKVRELGLDPHDSTASEIYYALMGLVARHDAFLALRLGVGDPGDVSEILTRLEGFVTRLDTPRSAWVLKQSVARRLLKATPPKKVMKQLGYRSIDSMIKRESAGELFLGIRMLESDGWRQSFIRKYKQLNPSDFEARDVEVLHLTTEKWGRAADAFVQREHQNVTYLKEIGIVGILPLPVTRMPGLTITLLPMVLHAINEIRMYSTYFKLQQVKPEFADTLSETLLTDAGHQATIAGHPLHWRVLHRHFGTKDDLPEFFEPHVQSEDLRWRKEEEVLYRLEPALHFWHDMDYVGIPSADGLPLSFNLTDLAISNINRLRYGQQVVLHMRESLHNELYARYLRQPSMETQALRQLDNREQDTFTIPEFEGAML